MSAPITTVTRPDYHRLHALLESEYVQAVGSGRTHLIRLKQELDRATIVESYEMLPEVITMNSTFRLLDLDRGQSDEFSLVYPEDACIAAGKLSIFSPLGAEVFGRRVGESVQFRIADRLSNKRVEELSFQPERVGAYNL